jgi:hemerythrin-like metal-binding protein
MKWTEHLSVGIDIIDNQHKELFNRINSLVEAIKQHICKHKISGVIQFLEDYVHTHFDEEERYMLRYEYPGYQFHKAQHEHFKNELSALKLELIKIEGGAKPGSYDLSMTTNQVVVDWILDHIVKVDKQLGKFLQTKI